MTTTYYCDNCHEDLEPEEALRIILPEHHDTFHGDDPAEYEIVGSCPLCGCVDCVREI